MNTSNANGAEPVLNGLGSLIPNLEALYKDVHAHPELSMQETRTASLAADRLRAAGYEVTMGVGKTGVVGLLRNGDGPTVMLRADMDALPVEEATGLPYASTVKMKDHEGNTVPVGHMCGHDMHVTWLVGATALFAQAREAWRGTLMAVFQPGEETAEGAQAMIDDGLFKHFPKPAVVLGQHVMVGPAGAVAGRAGAITSAADSLQIRLFGRGAHGSMPQSSIDPVVMAAATVMRLQTIVSREVAAAEAAVVTVGALQAGTKENVIPDEAIIKLNVRTFDEGVRKRVLAAITRIVNAEAAASGAPRPPEITPLDRYPLNVNDAEASKRVVDAFRRYFPGERMARPLSILVRGRYRPEFLRSDQDVAGNTAEVSGDKREDQNAEQIQPTGYSRDRPAEREHERTDKVKHEQQRHRGLLLITGRKGSLVCRTRLRVNAEGAAPTTRPAPRQQESQRPSAMSDG
jgi:amidohydrolase